MQPRKNFFTESERTCGILMPIFSLPGPNGIGEIGPSALNFIDFLHKSGQKYWQILPVSPTEPAFSNSPYMSPSAFAGNPLFISIEELINTGLLQNGDIADISFSEYQVDYAAVSREKERLLKLAWKQFKQTSLEALARFSQTNSWVDDYALFKTLKSQLDNSSWLDWPAPYKKRDKKVLEQVKNENKDEFLYYVFEQFIFYSQWSKLKKYAQKKGIHLIGDVPIYVAADSVDVWANQSIFQLHKKSAVPTRVAGVPPDYFSKTGQLWGNPLYRWRTTDKKTKSKLWQWWEQRLQQNFSTADVVRIDHFRGFESYWSVPAQEETAIKGKWVKGPGKDFFIDMERRLGTLPIIAEDLGVITPQVDKMRKDLGYPGMRILLFAFDNDSSNGYLPHNYSQNTVVYTGTHDNDTAVGWYLSPEVQTENKLNAKEYANSSNHDAGTFHLDLLHLAYCSVANTVIIPMQDILGFGNDCRVNTPGTIENNWQWRLADRFITEELSTFLRKKAFLYGRTTE